MRSDTIILRFCTYHPKPALSQGFAKDYDPIKVKSIKATSWSQNRGFWCIPRGDFNPRELLFDKHTSLASPDYPASKNKKQERHATKNQKPARVELDSFKPWMQSFARNMPENGVDPRHIQKLPGLCCSKTIGIIGLKDLCYNFHSLKTIAR